MDFNPFIKGVRDVLMETSDYKELAARLDYLLANKGFVIITGGPGRGKTTSVRNYIKGINSSLFKIVYTSLSTLTVAEFYKHLASELGLEVMSRKPDNFKNIQNEILRYSIEKRITPVIIIDEAMNYLLISDTFAIIFLSIPVADPSLSLPPPCILDFILFWF